jgi:RHS repeat-associated protein
MDTRKKPQVRTSIGILLRWFALSLFFVGAHAFAQTGGTVTYVYTDPQGTPLAEADANGNITATFEYTPYGTYAPQGTSAPGPTPNGPSYTGHVNDPETNLVYMQARYYDPVVGRFLTVDPVSFRPGDTFGFNRFAYAENNPIDNTDPTGACPNQDPCFEATPANFYNDTIVGRMLSHAVGDSIAVFRDNHINPLTHLALDGGQVQDAKLGVLLLFAPAPTRTEQTVMETLRPMARGLASEARVLLDMGLTKNTQAVATAEGKAIPDALTKTMSVEVKDTLSVTLTKQLRIQTQAAKAAGRESVLVTGKNTHVSEPAQRAFDRIIRRDDLGPQ